MASIRASKSTCLILSLQKRSAHDFCRCAGLVQEKPRSRSRRLSRQRHFYLVQGHGAPRRLTADWRDFSLGSRNGRFEPLRKWFRLRAHRDWKADDRWLQKHPARARVVESIYTGRFGFLTSGELHFRCRSKKSTTNGHESSAACALYPGAPGST